MDPQPIILEGRHVRLEPLAATHASGLLAALTCDPGIWQWLSIEPPLTEAAMEAYIASALEGQASGKEVPFAQICRDDGRVIGSTRYLSISRNDRGLEIGWTWIGMPWQRTAINTEAKFLLLRHAFEDLGAARVQLKTDARNLQSQAAIERIGGVREGVLRKFQRTQGGFLRNTVMFSILDDEWPAIKNRLVEKMAR
jgi:N-acetyltransferase